MIPIAEEIVPLADLRPHPRNYRRHPPDQLAHICASIEEFGFYRNIVIAREGTILAGHGVILAAAQLGIEHVPVRRVDLDPDSPAAIKLLTADNEIGHLAEIDDRLLSELLREVNDVDTLLGTGFDDKMLANLVYVTRDFSEIRDHNEAAEWLGMPRFDGVESPWKLILNFDSAEDRDRFLAAGGATIGLTRKNPDNRVWSGQWPARPRDDVRNLAMRERDGAPAEPEAAA